MMHPTMAQPIPTNYHFCPAGGIVCVVCCYPVRFHAADDKKKAIYLHENNNKLHPQKSDLSTWKSVSDSYELFTEKVAHEFVNELPSKDAARGIIVNTSGMVQCDILRENWYKVTTCPSGTPT